MFLNYIDIALEGKPEAQPHCWTQENLPGGASQKASQKESQVQLLTSLVAIFCTPKNTMDSSRKYGGYSPEKLFFVVY